MKLITRSFVVVIISAMIVTGFTSGCNPRQTITSRLAPTLSPTPTEIPTHTSTPTPTPTATRTQTPTSTVDPYTPLRIPSQNENFGSWAWRNNTIQIWVNNLTLCSGDYSCPDEKKANKNKEYPSIKLWKWDPDNPWHFGGQGNGDFILTFDKSYTDIVITAGKGEVWMIDYAAGIIPDGREVPFQYTYDGNGNLVVGTFFFDTDMPESALNTVDLLTKAEVNGVKVVECGMVGSKPDDNYTLFTGAMLGRLPKGSWDRLNNTGKMGWRGLDPYEIVGIHIIAIPYNTSLSSKVCTEVK